jgi:hypothetical protein
MESALITKEAKVRSALAATSLQLLLLIAAGFGISYLVPACISFASRPVNDEESRPSPFAHGSGFNLHAELVCESTPPRLRERSACNLPE